MTSVADPQCEPDALGQGNWPRTASRQEGVLSLGGVDVRDLAVEFGTPLVVCDEDEFRGRCRELRGRLGDDGASYTAGGFCCREVLRWAAQEGLAIAVGGEAELRTALSAGLTGRILTLQGSNKSVDELARAMDAGVERIVVDSFEEIARVAYLAERGNAGQKVLVRVTVAEDADPGQPGFAVAPGEAAEAVRRVLGGPDLELAGLDCRNGPQAAVRLLTGLAAAVWDEHGVQVAEFSLGAGAGGPETAQILAEAIDRECRDAGLSRPRLTVDAGMGIAGPAMVALYEVGTVRPVSSGGLARAQVGVHGWMSDNVRTARCDARPACVLASRESTASPVLSGVTGRHREGGDSVVLEACLPADLAPGDLLAVAGAEACRGNNRLVPRAAVVGVRAGTARILVRRETLDDLLRLDAG